MLQVGRAIRALFSARGAAVPDHVAQSPTQPLNQPYPGPTRRRLDWYVAFAIGNSEESSE
jgi:hypothetical protein